MSSDTLRCYERIGLISADRDSSNRRIYPETITAKLELITDLRAAGFVVREISDFLDVKKRSCRSD